MVWGQSFQKGGGRGDGAMQLGGGGVHISSSFR